MEIVVILSIMTITTFIVSAIVFIATRKYIKQRIENALLNEYLQIQNKQPSVERAVSINNWKRKLEKWSQQSH